MLPILPVSHALNAVVRVPGSKSLTNRVLMIAALAEGHTRIANALFSDDSLAFGQALQTLGFDVQFEPVKSEMVVAGLGGAIPAQEAALSVGNAGTAARFLTALVALGRGEFVIDGDARMRERPIAPLVSALSALGARLTASGTGCPPVRVSAAGLTGGQTSIGGEVSSQFLSALLMAGPYAREAVEIEVSGALGSKPYVDMTLAVMADFGIDVKRDGYRRFQTNPNRYRAMGTYVIESDATAASYFFAAPAVAGGSVRVENISRDSKQGDLAFLDILADMGCMIHSGRNYIEVTSIDTLTGVNADMRDIPDTAQTLAAIAPFASTPTTISGIESARRKETDRIAAMCAELARLGVRVEEHRDGLTVYPCNDIRPAVIQTYNDHRMAMAFSLIGLRLPGVTIENPACVSKTFPDYFEVLENLR